MILEIKKVKQCRNGAMGNFTILGDEKALITISLKKNKLMNDYAATLLHEMLHCYTTLLRAEGFKATNKIEHEWIEACESAVIKEALKVLKRRK